MKRPAWLAILVVIVLAVGTAIVAVSWTRGWFGSCNIVQSVAPNVGGAIPNHDGLRVVEQGFTHPADEVRSISVGALLENTTDSIAYHTRITVQLLDADNENIGGYDTTDDHIPIIMPGRRIGIGLTAHPTTEEAAKAAVAAIQVSTETTQWLSRDALGDDFEPVTAEYRSTIRRNPNLPNSTEIHFAPKVDNCRPMQGWNPAVLFRDSSGTLIGGTRQYVLVTASCAHSSEETWVIPRGTIPQEADDARTEIYPYCDIQ
jgi:hypothetical protein